MSKRTRPKGGCARSQGSDADSDSETASGKQIGRRRTRTAGGQENAENQLIDSITVSLGSGRVHKGLGVACAKL